MNGKCLDKCSNEYIRKGNYCVIECPESQVLWNGKCLVKCPSDQDRVGTICKIKRILCKEEEELVVDKNLYSCIDLNWS